MAVVDRDEFREFVARFDKFVDRTGDDFKDIRDEMSDLRGDVRVLMDARNNVAAEMPDGNFNIKKSHVVMTVAILVGVVAVLKFLVDWVGRSS